MNNFTSNGDPIRFFHICTDGENNGIVHTCEKDYRMATTISTINAYKNDVSIICYCHMATHSHFIVECGSRDQATSFIDNFKMDYGRYAYMEHGVFCTYREAKVTIKEISDVFYLKKCICYVLLNPVVAKIVVRPEDYKWSSFNAYFDNNKSTKGFRKAKDMTTREIREIFHTHVNLQKSNLVVDENNELVLKSFINYRLVETLFKGRTEFFKSLALTNSVVEEQIYAPSVVRFNDNEVRAEAVLMAKQKYRVDDIADLTHSQKIALLLPLRKQTGAAPSRLARALDLKKSEVAMLLLQKH